MSLLWIAVRADLMHYDERENLCYTFRLIHSQCSKNFVDLQRRNAFYIWLLIWNNTSHLGSHRVLPTGRCPSKIPETFELELLGCQTLFSSRSPRCFLPNVLLFSLAALLVHQNSPLSFPDHPYHCGSINKCTNWYPQMSPRPLSVCIEIKWQINRKCSTHFIS